MTMELMSDSDLPAKYELIAQVRFHIPILNSSRLIITENIKQL